MSLTSQSVPPSNQFDYTAMAEVATQLLQQFGMVASLVRGGVYRSCYVCMTEWMPKDASTQLANPTDRQVFISATYGGVPAMPPDWEQDQLVTYKQPPSTPPVQDEVLPFTMPIKPIQPAGIPVVYQTTVKR